MPPIYLVPLIALDIILYTIRSYTSKLYADANAEDPIRATLVFSAVTGLAGFFLTILFAVRSHLSFSGITLACGVFAGAALLLYNIGCIRAAQTGPYAVQSVIGMSGSVLLPLLFEGIAWGLSLSAVQYVGVVLTLASFVLMNGKGFRLDGAKPGYWGWVTLIFLSNGAYSILMAAQQRWTEKSYRTEMVAAVFLSSAVMAIIILAAVKRGGIRNAFRMAPKVWGFALVSSFALTAAMNLLVVLLGYVSASILYPVQNSAILVLLVMLSVVHLREKISGYAVLGIVLAISGIVLLSL